MTLALPSDGVEVWAVGSWARATQSLQVWARCPWARWSTLCYGLFPKTATQTRTKVAAVTAAAATAALVYWSWCRRRQRGYRERMEQCAVAAAANRDTHLVVAVERLDSAEMGRRVLGFETALDVRRIAADAAADPSVDESLVAWRYPQVVAPGTCSRHLAPDLFDALGAANTLAACGEDKDSTLARLRSLRAVCAAVSSATKAQWVGVYQVVPLSAAASAAAFITKYGGDASASNLLKLAYCGAPSRPFFPLTKEFAAGSNNSTVAMSGTAVVYHDVLALPSDAPYYTCDGKVRAEACVPIFEDGDASKPVIGIMDVEAFEPRVFDPAVLGLVLTVCAQLGQAGLCAS